MYKALVKVWKTKELSSVKISQPRRGQLATNPVGDEGKGQDELVSIVVTAQTPGGLVKKVNMMVGTALAEEEDLPVERDKHGDPVPFLGTTAGGNRFA